MVFVLLACRWPKEKNNVGAHLDEVLIMIAVSPAISCLTFGKRYQNDYIATGATGGEVQASDAA